MDLFILYFTKNSRCPPPPKSFPDHKVSGSTAADINCLPFTLNDTSTCTCIHI